MTRAEPLLDALHHGPEPRFMSDNEDIVSRHGHHLVFGVLVSRKTLYGDGNKYPRMYPKIEEAHLAVPTHGAQAIVHYSQDDDRGLGAALVDAVAMTERPGRRVDGVQVNVAWPRVDELVTFTDAYPNRRLILQVGPKACAEVSTWDDLWKRIQGYAWLITDVLVDRSAGRGQPADPSFVLPIVEILQTFAPHLGVGVAGGLGPDTLDLVAKVTERYPRTSLCAERRLRDDGDGGGDLVIDKVRRYVSQARQMIDGSPVALLR